MSGSRVNKVCAHQRKVNKKIPKINYFEIAREIKLNVKYWLAEPAAAEESQFSLRLGGGKTEKPRKLYFAQDQDKWVEHNITHKINNKRKKKEGALTLDNSLNRFAPVAVVVCSVCASTLDTVTNPTRCGSVHRVSEIVKKRK